MDDKTQLVDMAALGKAQKGVNASTYECMYPGCKENSIGSHSQQRRGQLLAIASKSGDVYAVEKNLYRYYKGIKAASLYSPYRKTPISEASVFPGFCSDHDKDLFLPIEKKQHIIGDPEQAALFFLRAISFEYTQKNRMSIFNSTYLHHTKESQESRRVMLLKKSLNGLEHYLKNEGAYALEKALDATTTDPEEKIRTSWIEIEKKLPISTACTFSPLMQFQTRYMEENPSENPPFVSFNIVPNEKTTHVVVSWLPEHDEYSQWLDDALNDKMELELLINQFPFGESEDTCISPSLWEQVSSDNQQLICAAIGYSRLYEQAATLPHVVKL